MPANCRTQAQSAWHAAVAFHFDSSFVYLSASNLLSFHLHALAPSLFQPPSTLSSPHCIATTNPDLIVCPHSASFLTKRLCSSTVPLCPRVHSRQPHFVPPFACLPPAEAGSNLLVRPLALNSPRVNLLAGEPPQTGCLATKRTRVPFVLQPRLRLPCCRPARAAFASPLAIPPAPLRATQACAPNSAHNHTVILAGLPHAPCTLRTPADACCCEGLRECV